MHNVTIKFICIILVIISFLTCIPMTVFSCETYDYSYYNDFENIQLLQNQEQVYLVGTKNKTISIDGVHPNSFNLSLELDSPVISYNLFNDIFVFVCDNNALTEIVLYDISTDIITSFNTNKRCTFSNYRIAYSNGLVYLCDTDGSLFVYNSRGKLVNNIELNTTTHSLICNYCGDVYAVSHNGLIYIGDSYYDNISYYSFKVASKFISNCDFVDYTGKMFRITDNGVEELIEHSSDVNLPSGGVYKNFAMISSANKLYAVDINSNEIKRAFDAESLIEQICIVDDVCVLFLYKYGNPTVQKVNFNELKSVYHSNFDKDFASQRNPNLKNEISSDVYDINFENQYISGIAPHTTVAKFKQNIHHENLDIEFFRYGGKVLESGNVGTATLVRFFDNNTTYEFELCIKGELTGEGNVNSRDLQEMFDIILGNITVTGVFSQAADMDSSGEIDLVDMVLINRAV